MPAHAVTTAAGTVTAQIVQRSEVQVCSTPSDERPVKTGAHGSVCKRRVPTRRVWFVSLGTKRRAGKAGTEICALYPERHPHFKWTIKGVSERIDKRTVFIDFEIRSLETDPNHT